MTQAIVKDEAYYLNLITSKKATAQDKIDFANLLNTNAAGEAKAELQGKIKEVIEFIRSKGLTLKQVISGAKENGDDTAKVIFTFTAKDGKVYTRKDGDKGPFPKWATDIMKKELKKQQALELAGDNAKAKAFVEKIYK